MTQFNYFLAIDAVTWNIKCTVFGENIEDKVECRERCRKYFITFAPHVLFPKATLQFPRDYCCVLSYHSRYYCWVLSLFYSLNITPEIYLIFPDITAEYCLISPGIRLLLDIISFLHSPWILLQLELWHRWHERMTGQKSEEGRKQTVVWDIFELQHWPTGAIMRFISDRPTASTKWWHV